MLTPITVAKVFWLNANDYVSYYVICISHDWHNFNNVFRQSSLISRSAFSDHVLVAPYTAQNISGDSCDFSMLCTKDEFRNFCKCFEAIVQSILPDHCLKQIFRNIIELTLLSVRWKKHTCSLKYFEQCMLGDDGIPHKCRSFDQMFNWELMLLGVQC